MFEDNEGCEALATNTIMTAKTKHIDIRHHFVRDLVKNKTLDIVWLSTTEMIADILTKSSLPTAAHKKHTDIMLGGTYGGPHARTTIQHDGGVLTCTVYVDPLGNVGS